MAGYLRARLCVLYGIVLVFLLSGCATTGGVSPERVASLEKKVSNLELMMSSAVGAAFRPFTAVTGGGAGSVDKIDGASLSDGDGAVVLLTGDSTYGNARLFYVLDATSSCGGDDTNTPPLYFPPNTNPGTKCWELVHASNLPPMVGDADDFDDNFTGAYLYGGTYVCNGTGTVLLPSVAAIPANDVHFSVITQGAIAVVIDPNAIDSMLTDGTQQADGANITNLSTAGDMAVVQNLSAAGWLVNTNGWTQE